MCTPVKEANFKKKYPPPQLQLGGGIFNITQLKLIALIVMILDHVHYVFSGLYEIPIQFKYVGRIAFPLYIFAVVEGYAHTKDKRKYMTRLLVLSIIMQLGNSMLNILLPRADGFNLTANIFVTLFLIVLSIQQLENIKNKKNVWMSAITLISILLISQYVEYGTLFIILGMLMHMYRTIRKQQIIIYTLFSLIYVTSYQFMMILAAPLMLLYNSHKGKNLQKLFYIIYPIHLWLLYILAIQLQN